MGDEGTAAPLLPAGAVRGIQLSVKPPIFKCQIYVLFG